MNIMVIAGVIAFLVGVVLMGLALTFIPGSSLLLFGMVVTAGGVVLLFLSAKSGG